MEPDLISLPGFMRSGLVAFKKQPVAECDTLGPVPSHLLTTSMVSRVVSEFINR